MRYKRRTIRMMKMFNFLIKKMLKYGFDKSQIKEIFEWNMDMEYGRLLPEDQKLAYFFRYEYCEKGLIKVSEYKNWSWEWVERYNKKFIRETADNISKRK